MLIINYYYNNNYKSHNNYCSVGVMELCLLNLLILIDCFLCNSYPCVLFESLWQVINQDSHVYSWNLGKFTSFIFWNFEITLVSLGRFQNFKKMNLVNFFQISLLNMSLLVLIERVNNNILQSVYYWFNFFLLSVL